MVVGFRISEAKSLISRLFQKENVNARPFIVLRVFWNFSVCIYFVRMMNFTIFLQVGILSGQFF